MPTTLKRSRRDLLFAEGALWRERLDGAFVVRTSAVR